MLFMTFCRVMRPRRRKIAQWYAILLYSDVFWPIKYAFLMRCQYILCYGIKTFLWPTIFHPGRFWGPHIYLCCNTSKRHHHAILDDNSQPVYVGQSQHTISIIWFTWLALPVVAQGQWYFIPHSIAQLRSCGDIYWTAVIVSAHLYH